MTYKGRYYATDDTYALHPDHIIPSQNCIVDFSTDGSITISYKEGGDNNIWYGEPIGEGHWKLTGPGPHSEGTMHQLTPQARALEGHCRDGSRQLMWRITLPDPSTGK